MQLKVSQTGVLTFTPQEPNDRDVLLAIRDQFVRGGILRCEPTGGDKTAWVIPGGSLANPADMPPTTEKKSRRPKARPAGYDAFINFIHNEFLRSDRITFDTLRDWAVQHVPGVNRVNVGNVVQDFVEQARNNKLIRSAGPWIELDKTQN